MGGGGVHGSGSSRRKPVAPQWFNPSWHDDSDDEEVINGVCVFQNALNFSANKDTVRVEPASPSEAAKNDFPRSREGSVGGAEEQEMVDEKSTEDKRMDNGAGEEVVTKGALGKLSLNHSDEVKIEPEPIDAPSDTELGD